MTSAPEIERAEPIDKQEELVLKTLDEDSTKALLGLGADADFSSVASIADLTTASDPMVAEMKKAYEKGVTDNIVEGYGTPVQEDLANAAISQQVATVNNFNKTTQAYVIQAMSTAANAEGENEDIDVVFKAVLAYYLIKGVFRALRGNRKKLVVYTGILGSYNMGLYDSALNDTSIKKTWVTMGDNKVRETHKILRGDNVQISEPFIVNGVPIRFPRDPIAPPSLTINCRCFLSFSR